MNNFVMQAAFCVLSVIIIADGFVLAYKITPKNINFLAAIILLSPMLGVVGAFVFLLAWTPLTNVCVALAVGVAPAYTLIAFQFPDFNYLRR